jgi:peptidoglycan-associated lipoprotein
MTKHSMSTVSITLSLMCALSLVACDRNPKNKSLSATEEAPQPALPRAINDSGSTREAASRAAVLTQRIGFRFDDASLSPEARATLIAKVTVLQASPGMRLRLEGHADEQGSEEYNRALGMRRGLAAKRYLVQRGIDPQRLYVISYGEKQPLDPRHSEAAWSINRRVEFGIMSEPIRSDR